MEDLSDFLKGVVAAGNQSLEDAENISHELNWVIKFGKLRGGAPPTHGSVVALQQRAARCCLELSEVHKSLRGCTPKAAGSGTPVAWAAS